LEHLDYFSITIGKNNANWWTQSFFRGVGLNHQPVVFFGGRWFDDIFFGGIAIFFGYFLGEVGWNVGILW
jgi:hypothetical protein